MRPYVNIDHGCIKQEIKFVVQFTKQMLSLDCGLLSECHEIIAQAGVAMFYREVK